jgi:glycoprotein endo-alpha-1,2-mannosidase
MAALMLAVCGIPCISSAQTSPAPSPRIHALYYTWYGNPEDDGRWRHWDQKLTKKDEYFPYLPPQQLASNYYPALGAYSSRSMATLERHMQQFRDARIGVAVVSWWGIGDATDENARMLLDAAEEFGIKVAFNIEPAVDMDIRQMAEAIIYIIDTYGAHPAFYRDIEHGGKPLFYVWKVNGISSKDWASLLSPSGALSIRNTQYDSIMVGLYMSAGKDAFILNDYFDGFCAGSNSVGRSGTTRLTNWVEMARWAQQRGKVFIACVAPGYLDTRVRPWNVFKHDRAQGAFYDKTWQAAIAARPHAVCINSFNEWHEGSQIEPAVPKRTAPFIYQDYAPLSPTYYLQRTRQWVDILTTPRPLRYSVVNRD